MKKSKIILPALAAVLVIGLTVGTALAYFTAHEEAKGSAPVQLGSTTTITEEVDGLEKELTISNDGPESCWVRAKAFSAYPLAYSGTDWNRDASAPEGTTSDVYYYYANVVDAEKAASPLTIKINEGKYPEDAEDFNVIVVYESIRVKYDAEGKPIVPTAADWEEQFTESQIEVVTEAATTEGGE